MNLLNKAMERKIKSGYAIDLKDCKRLDNHTEGGMIEGNRKNPLYILDDFEEGMDYCDSSTESWIWSIGKRKSDGLILASTTSDLYQNDDFECLFLR